MRPEDATAAAREAAAQMRAAGAYANVRPSRPGAPPIDSVVQRLTDWSLIEPDLSLIVSVRRYGAPFVTLKKLLLRLLHQYHAQLVGNQSRYNVLMLGYVNTLERRVARLEEELRAARGEAP